MCSRDVEKIKNVDICRHVLGKRTNNMDNVFGSGKSGKFHHIENKWKNTNEKRKYERARDLNTFAEKRKKNNDKTIL